LLFEGAGKLDGRWVAIIIVGIDGDALDPRGTSTPRPHLLMRLLLTSRLGSSFCTGIFGGISEIAEQLGIGDTVGIGLAVE
jgi:hypothetical protein